MIAKIKAILSSVRFYEVVVGVVLYTLVAEGAITSDTGVAIATGICSVLGISVGIETADKLFTK